MSESQTQPRQRLGRRSPLELNGSVATVREWAERRGIPVNTAVRRLNLGWSPAQAFNPRRRDHPLLRVLTCRGRSLTLTQWSRECQVTVENVRNRLYLGWTPEQALGFAPPPGPKIWAVSLPPIDSELTYDGVTQTLRDWARERGIGTENVQRRIRLGWAVAQALEFEPRQPGPQAK